MTLPPASEASRYNAKSRKRLEQDAMAKQMRLELEIKLNALPEGDFKRLSKGIVQGTDILVAKIDVLEARIVELEEELKEARGSN